MDFALDTTVLPLISEKKGTLLLRSNHMKYGRATLNSNWWVNFSKTTCEALHGLYIEWKSTKVYIIRVFFNRHADREAEPKNYDVTKSDIDERDLLRATYNRIGNITDGVTLTI